ncbi:MAG: pitrilysin family protein [Patescibacteria group bacterium]
MNIKHRLSNNVRVLLSPLKDTQTVTVLVIFAVGSRYEQKRINGISHFIEHMMFKGTKKRPNSLAISKELDATGASYNAYTSKDVTGYWVKISADKLELALDIVSDMLYNSKFDAKEITREKTVICEELRMYRDNPVMHIDTVLEQLMFEGSSLGWDIGGEDPIIMALNRKDMVEFRDAHYSGGNVVVGIAGNVDEQKALSLSKKYFGKAFKKEGEAAFEVYSRLQASRAKAIIYHKETEQIQLMLGFHAYPYGHVDREAVELLATILGGTMSSRLFISIREKHGLCYSIHASHESYHDTGVFSVQSGLDKSRLEKAIPLILAELKKVRERGVTAQELKRSKDYKKGKLAISFEDSSNVVSWYARQEVLTGATLTPEQKLKLFNKVTQKDIMRVAKNLFQTGNINLALIGPYRDAAPFEKLLKL